MIANKKGIQTKCEVDVYIDNNNPKVDITDLEPSKPPEENTKGETVYNYEKLNMAQKTWLRNWKCLVFFQRIRVQFIRMHMVAHSRL